MLCDSFKEATEMEMLQQQKIEEGRHKSEMEFELKLRQLEMERRREERQHELSVLQLLSRQTPMAAFLVSQILARAIKMMVLASLHPVTGLVLTLAVAAATLMKPQATYNCKPKEHC